MPTAATTFRTAAMIMLIGGGGFAAAQCPPQSKFTAGDNAENDRFGHAVSTDGDAAIVGAPFRSGQRTHTGSAYVFRFDGEAWLEEATLTAADGAAEDWFGTTTSISGDVVVVGARRVGDDVGAAYVFRKSGNAWSQEAKLTAADGADGDQFGVAVSIDEDVVLVGAWGDDDRGNDSGSAYVFRFDGKTWIEEAKLTPAEGEAQDLFGVSVQIVGDAAIIGAYFDDDRAFNAGAAYIFRHDGDGWVREAKLSADDGAANDRFGWYLAMAGDRVIVGAPWADHNGTNSGAAYAFRHDGGTWVDEGPLAAIDNAERDAFGAPVTISGNRAVIGAPLNDDDGPNSGSAYVFRDTDGGWAYETKITAHDGAPDDYFGEPASLSGDRLLVGAWGVDDNGQSSGAVYAFDLGCLDGCPADLDGSGDVGNADLLLLLAAWGADGGPEDLDGSGTVDLVDLLMLLAAWGVCL